MSAAKLKSITAEYDDGRKLVLDLKDTGIPLVAISLNYQPPWDGPDLTHRMGLSDPCWRALPAPEPLPVCLFCGINRASVGLSLHPGGEEHCSARSQPDGFWRPHEWKVPDAK